MLRTTRILVLLTLLSACEIPRSKESTVPAAAPTPVPSAKKDVDQEAKATQPEQNAAPPQEKVQGDISRVDGRTAPSASSSLPQPVTQERRYAFVPAPAPARPDADSLTIEPRPRAVHRVAKQPRSQVDPVTLDTSRQEFEAALIAKGIRVVDRTALEQMEAEIYLQHASAAKAEVDRTLDAGESRAKRLTFESQLVGRKGMNLYGATWWGLSTEGARPLLNGGKLEPQDQVASGHLMSARSILQLGNIEFQDGLHEQVCRQPVASEVPHLPIIARTVKTLPNAEMQEAWQQDDEDAFHLRGPRMPVFYDPDHRALWHLSDVWIGRRVARQAYLARRTTEQHVACAGCERVLSTKSTTDVSKEETPEMWQCPECLQQHSVKYFDGYCLPGHEALDDQATLFTTWLPLQSGLYPVLSVKRGDQDLSKGACLAGTNWKEEDLPAVIEKLGLLRPAAEWCWISKSGTALLLPTEELARLADASAVEGVPLPAVDDEGQQRYSLLRTHRVATFAAPVTTASLSVRLISTESSQVILSGTMEIDYRSLLSQTKQMPVTADGVDLSSWPTSAEQRAELKKALAEQVAAQVAK